VAAVDLVTDSTDDVEQLSGAPEYGVRVHVVDVRDASV
jgi:hypothetical protein